MVGSDLDKSFLGMALNIGRRFSEPYREWIIVLTSGVGNSQFCHVMAKHLGQPWS
jgi:hypothetical protein